jgi:peptidyl-prolyl cis-trans isomerase A (cyclophilin A)
MHAHLILHPSIFWNIVTMPTAQRGNPMRVIAIGLWAFLASVWLIGCGGSLGDSMLTGAALVKTPTVTDVQADRLSYRQITQFKVTGTALDTSVTASARNCSGLVAVAPTGTVPGGSASSTELNWRCTPTATGTAAVELEIKGPGASLLKSQTFAIPEPQVTMVTTLGSLVIELNPTSAPVTVDNFLQYVRDGFYTNILFHRVIGGFVAQGGWLVPATGPAGTLLSTATTTPLIQAGARAPIALESNKGLANSRGSIAMARTSDPNSATSQFYFNLADNPALNYVSDAQPGYAAFGRVVQGLTVMDAIGAVPTAVRFGQSDFPLNDVLVQSTTQTK